MTVPGALDVISDLASRLPEIIVGAGTVLDAETASSRFFPARLSEATITSGRSKRRFPKFLLWPQGGVNQQTALNYILAGASVLGVGSELIPKEALEYKQEERIHELARRFLARVKEARGRMAAAH